MAREFINTSLYNDANLVAYYKLEDVNDSKASYTLTNNGTVTFVAGKFNNGANFVAASDQYLSTTSTLGIDGGACSYSMWVNFASLPASNNGMALSYQANNTSKTEYLLQYYNDAGTLKLWFDRAKPGVGDQTATYTTTLSTSTWYHVVMTYDGTNLKGYLNGAEVATVAASGNGSSNGTEGFRLGRRYNETTNDLNGMIDDVAIFSRALTANEVRTIYASNGSLKVLVVGGGGGGADNTGGGGGAGGFRYNSDFPITPGSYSVTVGGGGQGGQTDGADGAAGGNSVFDSITSLGGGGGGTTTTNGSGGGGTQDANSGTGTVGQGNDGGDGATNGSSIWSGGGGGGASAAGGNSSLTGNGTSGNGGAGTSNSITGSAVEYAGGGSGGHYPNTGTIGSVSGGGGLGSKVTNGAGSNGTANTGGGGGGGGGGAGGGVGGNGGSGVVIVSYDKTTFPYAMTGGTITTSGNNVIHTFTADGTLVVTNKKFQKDLGGTLNTGLVSYYKLGDTYDFYGSNNLTNNGGATFTTGKVNNGVDLGANNSSKYLSVATNLGTAGGNFSGSAWINVTTAPATNTSETVFCVANDTTDNAYEIRYSDDGGTKKLRFNRGKENVANQFADYSVTLTTGVWYHVVWTYDGTNVKGYLNGGEVASAAASGSGTGTTSNITMIGSGWDVGRYFMGKIDEVGFWNKALSTTEISDLYNSTAGQTMNPPIEFDNATTPNFVTATSLTYSHTCGAGANRILFVGVWGDTTTDAITGVTYGGTAMTLIDKVSGNTTGDRWTYLYYLINPATGANNVVVSANASVVIGSDAYSYYGAKQSGVPDASAKVTQASNVTSQATTLNTVADNCWTVLYAKGNVVVASTNTVKRTGDSGGRTVAGDSGNPITPAGSFTMTVTQSSAPMATIMASFAPYVASTTNIKSINGLAYASIKNVNGLATASMKNFNGLS